MSLGTPDMALVVDGLNFVVLFPIFVSSERRRVPDIGWHFVQEAAEVEIPFILLVQSI